MYSSPPEFWSVSLDMRQPEDLSEGQDSRGPGLASSHGVPSGSALQT